jgi:hypothetical protein
MRRLFGLAWVLVSMASILARCWGQEAVDTRAASQDAVTKRIESRQEALSALPADKKQALTGDIQKESREHFGFDAFKNVNDLIAVDPTKLSLALKGNLDMTVNHVVVRNLFPLLVEPTAIASTGDQVYPDLQAALNAENTNQILQLANRVGRIRYWVKTDQPEASVPDSAAYLAGTGFVVGPGLIATACHVLDYITDDSSGSSMSSTVWVKFDLSADPNTHQAYAISNVVGKGSLEGEDYAVLSVSAVSEDGASHLPTAVPLGDDAKTTFVGVIGYPDIDGATKECAPGGTGCDETAQWFTNFGQKNPGTIKIISPGRKTGGFSPNGFPILTYDAPTLGGQSGSPVIDLQSGLVVGLHYCCTGYQPSGNEPSCAKLHPISLGDDSENEGLVIKDVVIPN